MTMLRDARSTHVTAGAPRALRRAWSVVSAMLLWSAALLGLVCIISAAAAYGFGVRLALFSTGSMAPTIPEGAVAITKDTPASQLRVGDVVTVRRPGHLPLTHRITSIRAVPGSPKKRSITMRGDANKMPDPAPYVVSHAGKVLASVPGGARWVVRLDSRPVLIMLSLLAAGLVTWQFWPRGDAHGWDDPVRSDT